ncbi:MAG: RluA family pseudouridine synthase [Phycisphaerales bacterium]|nr:RluA family pseudouridine synthase [Phycisphaerales bacterium]
MTTTGDDGLVPEADGPQHATWTVGRAKAIRLDKWLGSRIPWMSRTAIQKLVQHEGVKINGRIGKASSKLHPGDVVDVVMPPPPTKELPAQELPLDIIHEDDALIVLNKQPDLIVHPARSHQSGTLINGLAWYFQHRGEGALSDVGADHARPGVVHRLDRFTSGVMVVAKNDTAHWKLGRQFEQRRTRKRYLALVHGDMDPLTDVLDMPLGKHPTVREKYAVRWDDTGKDAITIYRVRERYGDFTLVELEIRTGRTHQIRVHLSHRGWPIAGDDMYGGRALEVRDVMPAGSGMDRMQLLLDRQALHATMLGFTHPVSEEEVTFIAPLRGDLAAIVHALRARGDVHRPKVPGTELDLDVVIPEQTPPSEA